MNSPTDGVRNPRSQDVHGRPHVVHGHPRDVMALLAAARPASLDPAGLSPAGTPADPRQAALHLVASAGLADPRTAADTRSPVVPPAGHGSGATARRRLALGGAGLTVTAAAAAAAVLATSTGGGQAPAAGSSTIVTAAMVRQVAAASRLALATSGKVTIGYKTTQNGAVTALGTDDITFSGKDWNDSISQSFPASKGAPASTQHAINRVVNGQLYLYIVGRSGHPQWVHDTNQSGHPSVTAPDPRKLLAVLTPAAHFKSLGWHNLGGLRLKGLQATDLRQMPPLDSMFSTQPGGQLTSLTVWVDSRGVVRRIGAAARGDIQTFRISPHGRTATLKRLALAKQQVAKAHSMAPYRKALAALERSGAIAARTIAQVTSVSVAFSAIGQPQHITVPPHAVSQYGRG